MANRSSNPAFRNIGNTAPTAATLQDMYNQPAYAPAPPTERYLTLDDVIAKTATVLLVALATAVGTIYLQSSGIAPNIYSLIVPAALVGFVLALVVIFKRSSNPALILAYAVAEGVFLGGITGVFQSFGPQYAGIGFQALAATIGVFVGMLVVYKTGAIRVTPKFTKMIVGAMIGIVAVLVVNMIASLLGFNMGIRDGGTLSIIISLVIIVVAALSFLLDFDAIENAIKQGAPAKSAWYFAFGLMVTLVWLYLEILRLLSYLRSN